MVNNFMNLPMVLDTVMPAGYQNTAGIPNNLGIYPRILHWDGATLMAGDTCVIQDHLGNVLFAATCSANGQGEYFDIAEGVRWEPLWQLVTLTNGTLYIWYTT